MKWMTIFVICKKRIKKDVQSSAKFDLIHRTKTKTGKCNTISSNYTLGSVPMEQQNFYNRIKIVLDYSYGILGQKSIDQQWSSR